MNVTDYVPLAKRFRRVKFCRWFVCRCDLFKSSICGVASCILILILCKVILLITSILSVNGARSVAAWSRNSFNCRSSAFGRGWRKSELNTSNLLTKKVPMEGADSTTTENEGRLEAVAEKADDGESNAKNHAHSCWFVEYRREAQRFARAHHHLRDDG